MRTVLDRRAFVAALALLLAGGSTAHADDQEDEDDDDHERARQALKEGHVRPLGEILDRVRDQLGGEVVGMELDRQDGRYVYEFKIITPEGRLRDVYVDALTAEPLKGEDD